MLLGRVSVLRPDGRTLVSPVFVGTNGGFLDATTLPSTGTYTILVDPQGPTTGGVSLTLHDVPADATAALAAGGSSTVATTVPGQNAAVTFAGTAGQRVSLEVTGVSVGSSLCCSLRVSILRPDGKVLVSPVFVGSNGGFVDATTLPSTGTYTVVVDPQGADTGAVTLTLYDVPADAGGSIAAGGAPVSVTTTVPGQNATLTFSGAAGQRIAVAVDDVSIGTSSCCAVRLSLARPNGAVLAGPVNAGTTGGFLDAVVLPQSGTYTIVVDPQGAATGTARMTLYAVPPGLERGTRRRRAAHPDDGCAGSERPGHLRRPLGTGRQRPHRPRLLRRACEPRQAQRHDARLHHDVRDRRRLPRRGHAAPSRGRTRSSSTTRDPRAATSRSPSTTSLPTWSHPSRSDPLPR